MKRCLDKGIIAVAFVIVAFLFVLLLSFSTSPLYLGYGGDASLYHQMGQLIVNGGIPYVDLCDNKGILLYLFYAAGIAIDAKWGMCLMQTVVLASTLFLWDKMMGDNNTRCWRMGILLFALALMACFYEGGGLTEELCLPLVCLPMLFWLRGRQSAIRLWQFFVVGVCAGAIAFIRVNNLLPLVGFYAVTLLTFLVRKEYCRLFSAMGFLLGGGLVVALLCVGYLFLLGGSGCLVSAWDNMFSFNVDKIAFHTDRSAYLGSPIPHVVTVVVAGLGTFLLFRRQWQMYVSCWFALICVGLSLWLRPYPHYHIMLLPIYVMLASRLTACRRWAGVITMVVVLALHCPPLYGTILRVRRELLFGKVCFQQGFGNFQDFAERWDQSTAPPAVFNFESYVGLSLLNSVQWVQCNSHPIFGIEDEFQTLMQDTTRDDFPQIIILSDKTILKEDTRCFIEQHYPHVEPIGEVSWRNVVILSTHIPPLKQ